MYGDVLEVAQNTSCGFQVWDHLGHTCCIFGFDQLNPDPYYQTWVPSGVGDASGTPFCTILGDHTVTGYCLATGQYDQTVVRVLAVDIKPDRRPSGFCQINKNGKVTFKVRVQAGHQCAIFGLDTVNPAYTTPPTGYGACTFEATCITKGDHTIQGTDLVTQQSDYTVVRVSEITATQWESILSPLDTNPNAGGGKRIYPDWLLTDFPNGPNPPRSWVQVHSTIDPPPSDPNEPFTVWFTHWDVDDPSSNQPPVDDETMGPENRDLGYWQMAIGGGATLSEVPVTAAGHAASVFAVSPKPGDNFRVNAQTLQFGDEDEGIVGAGIYGITVPQGVTDGRINRSDGQPLRTEEVTPMLTVWRRVQIERDSMGAVWGNTITGVVAAVTYPQSGQTDVNLGLNLPNSHDDPDQFADQLSGTLTISGVGSYQNIVSSTAYLIANDHVVVNSVISQTAVGKAYSLVDDDSTVMPKLSDLAMMETKFRPAYILPVEATGSYNGSPISDTNATFVLNLDQGSASAINSVCTPVQDLPNSNSFWSGQVLGGFQPTTPFDFDGHGEAVVIVGTTPGNWWGSYNRCVIFLEVCNDVWPAPGANPTERATVVHEVGHMFQCVHADGGIMSEYPDPQASFTAASLDRIRRAPRPGAN
jgi:hypothetical protein